ncbi:MAG TPA: hypothetical protein VFV81_02055 [Verrucomicrobiae bacterium]|nr:hypothetical protein [Verrucomicrobiae bacterium]
MRICVLLAFLAFSLGARAASPAVRCGDEILRHQAPDGAIAMDRLGPTNRVVPYFGNLAALGLLSVYSTTHESRFRESAEQWADWYAAHQNVNGTIDDFTGAAKNWRATGDYDSTDSYAATYLSLLGAIAEVDPTWMTNRYARIRLAVQAIVLTRQTNGLTLAKPGWPIAYTMDNMEVWRGLRAAAQWAALSGHAQDATHWNVIAGKVQAAIGNQLWDAQRENYAVGLQTNGARIFAGNEWYPGTMANLMAIGWQDFSGRNAAVYRRMLGRDALRIPVAVKTEADWERLVWWGFAAAAAGDEQGWHAIQARLAAADPALIRNPALLGHACRLLTRPGPAAGDGESHQ